MRDVLSIVGATLNDWYEDRAPRLGAALAFYTIFALLPSLILVIALGGMVLGRDAAQAEILDQVRYLAGEAGARAIEATLIAARTESLNTPVRSVSIYPGATAFTVILREAISRAADFVNPMIPALAAA